MLQAALPVFVYQLTGSTLATGAMFAVIVLPGLLFGSVAGVLVDRGDRKRIMVAANLVQTVGLLPLLLVTSADRLWIVYVVAFCQAAVAQVVRPAQGALLPRLIPDDDLVAANSLQALNGNLSRLVGPALGGAMIATTGLASVALADAASFLGAAVLIAAISTDTRPPTRAAEHADVRPHSLVEDWLAGLRVVWHDRTLGLLFAFMAISGIGEGAMASLFAPFVARILDGGDAGYGLMVSAQAVGGLLGSVWLTARPGLLSPTRMLGLGAVGLGLIDLLTFNYSVVIPGLLPGLLLMAIVGVPVAVMVVGRTTLMQTCTTDAYRGRVIGAMMTTTGLATLIGAVGGGLAGDWLGIVTVLNVQGLGYLLAGLLALTLLPRAVGSRSAAGTLQPV
jgi:MFS family permease